MKLYNTLGKTTQEFNPTRNQNILLYTCGPTVYHYMHIGNLRKAIFDDMLKRTLRAEGFNVEHIMNITDVGHLASDGDEGEDKLEQEAKLEKKSVWEIAKYYTGHALADYDAVNISRPNKIVKATDCIDLDIDFIKKLEDKGYAYKGDLAVYFDSGKLNDYGKLTGQNISEKSIASRKDIVIDSSKKNIADFALWIFTKGKHKNHAMKWQSPWGEGFPGWHIECSAIIKSELGETIDIHTGGVDHIGTHHTNEIAQSEALTGKPLAKAWMHTEFLLVDDEKMSKSKGNIYRIIDLEERGFDRLAYRLLVIQSHYRSQQNFTWQALKDAQNYQKNLQAVADLRFQHNDKSNHDFKTGKINILSKLSNDLNSPKALSELNVLFDDINNNGIGKNQITEFSDFIKWLDGLFSLDLSKSHDITDTQKQLIKARGKAREEKNWQESDRIRDLLLNQGLTLLDTQKGVIWRRT